MPEVKEINVNKILAAIMSFIICISCFFSTAGYAANTEKQIILNKWCLDVIKAPKTMAAGDHPVKIAVIDSGIWTGSPIMRKEAIAQGYNYVFGSNDTNDLIGHGSRTAGIIVGGKTENWELVGMGSHAELVPLVWISKYPNGVLANGGISALCSAIKDAVDIYGCQIINISSGINSDDEALREAVEYAEGKGVIVISAAGNSNQYEPDNIFYPAAYETVVGVGSVNENMCVSDFSQRNNGVTVTAPGEKVHSISIDLSKEFVQTSGTSYSVAYVSGFAALLLSKYPEMTPAEFRLILKETSQDLGEKGYDTAYGYGIISVSDGLEYCEKKMGK